MSACALRSIAPTGFSIDWSKVIFKMLHLKAIYGREVFLGEGGA